MIHFYCREPGPSPNDSPQLPDDLQFRWWTPDQDGFPRAGWRNPSNLFWWFLAKSGGFARTGFAELRIERHGKLLHRVIITPRWQRFPFMADGDLQIGHVWTTPHERRRRLARIAMSEAHRRIGGDIARLWYVTEASNLASGALARSCGYRLVGLGERTRPFGLRLFGQYRVEQFV